MTRFRHRLAGCFLVSTIRVASEARRLSAGRNSSFSRWIRGMAVAWLVSFPLSATGVGQEDEGADPTGKREAKMSSRELPELPQGVTSFGGAVLGDRIYIYGGHLGDAHHYYAEGQNRELWELDMQGEGGWKAISKGPGRQGLAMVAHGKELYRLGGFEARNREEDEQDLASTSDFCRYDFERQQWVELTPMPEPRSSFDAAVLGDWLYVVGGWAMDGDAPTKWLDSALRIRLDTADAEWERLPDPPFRRRANSVGHWQGKLYVVGGMQEKGGPTTKVAIYDPQQQNWVEGPALPGDEPMEGFGSSCFNVGGQLVVSTYGGRIYRLNRSGDGWVKLAEMPEGRFFHRLLPLSRNEFILLGGANMESGKRLDIEVLRLPDAEVATGSVTGDIR